MENLNNKQNFFSTIIKGFIRDLTRVSGIPHMIMHTGDDTMYLFERGYDASREPIEVTNQEGIYNKTPRGVVAVNGIGLMPDQLTNPYVRGNCQIETGDTLKTYNAEFRRVAVKLDMEVAYYSDSFNRMLDICQYIVTDLCYIRTFKVSYLGQVITVSYKLPDTLDNEFQVDLDGMLQDSKDRKITLNIELESNIPVYDNDTAVDSNISISDFKYKINV